MPYDHMVNEENTSPTPNNRGTPINSDIQIIQIIVDPVSYKITTHKNTICSARPTYSIEQCVHPDATYTTQKRAPTGSSTSITVKDCCRWTQPVLLRHRQPTVFLFLHSWNTSSHSSKKIGEKNDQLFLPRDRTLCGKGTSIVQDSLQ
jgi:hypothetical protein